jgi:hypothetical protein
MHPFVYPVLADKITTGEPDVFHPDSNGEAVACSWDEDSKVCTGNRDAMAMSVGQQPVSMAHR